MTGRTPLRRLRQNVHGVKRLNFAAFRYGKQDRFSLSFFNGGPTIAALIGSSQSREGRAVMKNSCLSRTERTVP
ncbi:hypothetical protein U8Q07_11300 [Rhizobium ruizarguesonis]|nr:hypothetical protein U8Q07_11300 [Rhizobium ruizarguesonis]